jgi:hypothetical protein
MELYKWGNSLLGKLALGKNLANQGFWDKGLLQITRLFSYFHLFQFKFKLAQ